MASFYIDYENVHNGGTSGIDQLTSNEYVYLFYSINANTMSIETVKRFMNSRCGVEFVEVEVGTLNALDFQLVTFLYTGTGQDDCHYIISKDQGFDAAIKMGKKVGIDNVKRFTTIMDAFKDYERYLKEIEKVNLDNENKEAEQIVSLSVKDMPEADSHEDTDSTCEFDEEKYRTAIKDRIKRVVQKKSNLTLPREALEISCEGVCNCDSKMKLYHFLRRELGDKRGRSVYAAINEDFLQIKLDYAV